ncbi:hypothetical protein [Allisonella histaminiformans]|uniref:hypothetical protein n=1 Tax=Allisonella histaminiformans TaxID=209880 RepID=UPI0035223589
MIRLGELLKVIDLDGPSIGVYIDTSPYMARRIDEEKLPDYCDREVLQILFDTTEIDYENYQADFLVEVKIAGPMLEEDKKWKRQH